jgi:hypothetical protein
MRKNSPKTPLLALLRDLKTDDKRDELASLAGTSRNYLYQLAGCYRGEAGCCPALAERVAAASVTLRKKYKTPVVTAAQLVDMCKGCGS